MRVQAKLKRFRRSAPVTHGMACGRTKGLTPEYVAWQNMKRRCYNANRPDFKYYGGRGIQVCERWLHSFENFYRDMGLLPEGLTLDRINVNGNYEPFNCRWASSFIQHSNIQPRKMCRSGLHHFVEGNIYYYKGTRTCKLCKQEYAKTCRRKHHV